LVLAQHNVIKIFKHANHNNYYCGKSGVI